MTATRPPGYDDRSAAPVEASRRGAHRARPKAIAAILPVVAGIAVVLLVIGGVYTVVGGRASNSSSSSAGELDEGAQSTADPSAAASEGKGDQGADEESPTAEESQDAGAGAGAEGGGSKVDKTIPLVVLNSLSISGLAAKYQTQLEEKGWSVERTDNSNNKDLPVTIIYYEGDEMKPSANAVRKALGLGEIEESSEVNPGKITVVLGEDTQ